MKLRWPKWLGGTTPEPPKEPTDEELVETMLGRLLFERQAVVTPFNPSGLPIQELTKTINWKNGATNQVGFAPTTSMTISGVYVTLEGSVHTDTINLERPYQLVFGDILNIDITVEE